MGCWTAGGGTGLLRGKVLEFGDSGMGATDERCGFRVFLAGGGAVVGLTWTFMLAEGRPDRYVSTIGADMACDVDARTRVNVVSGLGPSRVGSRWNLFLSFPEDETDAAILSFIKTPPSTSGSAPLASGGCARKQPLLADGGPAHSTELTAAVAAKTNSFGRREQSAPLESWGWLKPISRRSDLSACTESLIYADSYSIRLTPSIRRRLCHCPGSSIAFFKPVSSAQGR